MDEKETKQYGNPLRRAFEDEGFREFLKSEMTDEEMDNYIFCHRDENEPTISEILAEMNKGLTPEQIEAKREASRKRLRELLGKIPHGDE